MTRRSVTPLALQAMITGRHTQVTSLQHLPQEMLLMISAWLPLLDLVSLSQVSECVLFSLQALTIRRYLDCCGTC